jgi:DNA invertase Pin-like site-specific DNA recombinase
VQERAIRSECERRGYHLAEVVRDEGLSAKDLNRPGLQYLLCRLAAREVDGVVVAKLDRLTRSALDLLQLLQWTNELGCALIVLDFGLDTSTPTGRLVAGIIGQVIEWERGVISDRTREAAKIRRMQGRKMGRPGVRDALPEIAERVRLMRSAGTSWQKIADTLNDAGVPTVRGGMCWRVSSVQAAAGYVRPPRRASPSRLPTVARGRRRFNPLRDV